MVRLVASRGTCLRRRVGCVIVDEHNYVMATGYNGVHRGASHCNEATHIADVMRAIPGTGTVRAVGELTYGHACPGANAPSGTALLDCKAVHAEQNALLQCGDTNRIHTVYCTASPCVTCMRMLANTSVKRIAFLEAYPHVESYFIAQSLNIGWDLIGPDRDGVAGVPTSHYGAGPVP